MSSALDKDTENIRIPDNPENTSIGALNDPHVMGSRGNHLLNDVSKLARFVDVIDGKEILQQTL